MQLIIDSVPFNWSKEATLAFYADAIHLPADTFVIGDTLCASNSALDWQEWRTIGKRLAEAGKQVIYSSMAFHKSHMNVTQLHKYVTAKDTKLEIASNFMLLMRRDNHVQTPFCTSRHLDVSNNYRAQQLLNTGAMFVPIYASTDLLFLLRNIDKFRCNKGVEFDVLVHGDMSLEGLPQCQYNLSDVGKAPENMDCPAGNMVALWQTQRPQPQIFDLVAHLPALMEAGVRYFRIKPTQPDMQDIVDKYAKHLTEAVAG